MGREPVTTTVVSADGHVLWDRARAVNINHERVVRDNAWPLGMIVEAAVRAEADLSGAALANIDLRFGDIHCAKLDGADLSGADLRQANLSQAHLNRADLRGADLSGAWLWNTHLEDADLRHANLPDLRGALIRGVNLAGACIGNGISWETYLAEVAPQLLREVGDCDPFDIPPLWRQEVRRLHRFAANGLISRTAFPGDIPRLLTGYIA